MGSKAAGASEGAVFAGKLKQQQSKVLTCPKILISRGKEGGRGGGAGSRAEPGHRGRGVRMGSRVPLLPGEHKNPPEPSRSWQRLWSLARMEQGPGWAEHTGQNCPTSCWLSTDTPSPPNTTWKRRRRCPPCSPKVVCDDEMMFPYSHTAALGG